MSRSRCQSCCLFLEGPGLQIRWSSRRRTRGSRGGRSLVILNQRSRSHSITPLTLGHEMKVWLSVSRHPQASHPPSSLGCFRCRWAMKALQGKAIVEQGRAAFREDPFGLCNPTLPEHRYYLIFSTTHTQKNNQNKKLSRTPYSVVSVRTLCG